MSLNKSDFYILVRGAICLVEQNPDEGFDHKAAVAITNLIYEDVKQ
jgi:hypothetical protein